MYFVEPTGQPRRRQGGKVKSERKTKDEPQAGRRRLDRVVQPPHVPYMKRLNALQKKLLLQGMQALKDRFNARYAVKPSMGQFWIVDKASDSRILAMSPNETDANNIAEALSIWVQLP